MEKIKRLLWIAGLGLIFCNGCSRTGGGEYEITAEPGPFGAYSAPIDLRIGMGVDANLGTAKGETPTHNDWIKAIKDTLNINVQVVWQVDNSNLDQKIDFAIAVNDLPDALVVNQSQLNRMIEKDQLEDLSSAYQDYASPVMKKIMESTQGKAMQRASFQNKMMAIPSMDAEDMSMMWIRKDWLDQLKLEPPRTMEELEKVAKAFVIKDPDQNGEEDTVGITAGAAIFDDFRAGPTALTLDPIFSAYHSYPGFWVKGEDGKLVYGSLLPETKKALSKLRELYTAGLLDKNMGLYKNVADPIVMGKAGIFFAPFNVGYWPLPDVLNKNPKANWQAYALPLDDDDKYNAKIFDNTKTYLVVRKGFLHPEAVIKIQNLILRDEQKYGITFQPLRNVLAPRDEIPYTVTAIQNVLKGEKIQEDYAEKSEYKLLGHDLKTIRNVKLPPYDNLDISYWNTEDPDFSRAYSLLVGGRNLQDPYVHKITSLNYNFLPSTEKLWGNLSSLEQAAFQKIIMGAASLDTFDDFVREWNAQGGAPLTEGLNLEVQKR